MDSTVAKGCTVHAPAKLNLCLELLGKRADGFHELRTLMATIRLRDTLRITPTTAADPAVSLRVQGGGSDIPTDRTNLVVRALDALREEAGVVSGARVELIKRIPSQAGLGGGSSNAAAALVAGARVWGLDFGVERLAAIGARLGSDIPFFVHRILTSAGQVAVATGRGEAIARAASPVGLPAVVVKPPAGLSTAAVYAACQPEDYTGPDSADACRSSIEAMRRGDWQALAAAMRNNLQAAAERVAPWLQKIREAFQDSGVVAHQLSGSGSAYFGLMRTPGEARRIAARLRALRLGQVNSTTVG